MATNGAQKLRVLFMRNKGKAFTVEQACAVARWDQKRFLAWFRRERRDDGVTLGAMLLPVRDPDSDAGKVLAAVYQCRDQRFYDAEAAWRNRRAVREIVQVDAIASVNKALTGGTPDIGSDRRALAAPVNGYGYARRGSS